MTHTTEDLRKPNVFATLRELQVALRSMSESEVQELLAREREGPHRPAHLRRIYSRYKILREARERLELFGSGSTAAQVECLKRMWGASPFSETELEALRALEKDPPAMRDLLLQWATHRETSHAVPPAGWLPGPQAKAMTRAKILLESWVPGQTTFKEPSMVQVVKESMK